jgi:hypothetical protein
MAMRLGVLEILARQLTGNSTSMTSSASGPPSRAEKVAKTSKNQGICAVQLLAMLRSATESRPLQETSTDIDGSMAVWGYST